VVVTLVAIGKAPFESFRRLFYNPNVGKESYFDQMTHFDFRTLLPALKVKEFHFTSASEAV